MWNFLHAFFGVKQWFSKCFFERIELENLARRAWCFEVEQTFNELAKLETWTHHREQSGDNPNNKSHVDRSGVFQHAWKYQKMITMLDRSMAQDCCRSLTSWTHKNAWTCFIDEMTFEYSLISSIFMTLLCDDMELLTTVSYLWLIQQWRWCRSPVTFLLLTQLRRCHLYPGYLCPFHFPRWHSTTSSTSAYWASRHPSFYAIKFWHLSK